MKSDKAKVLHAVAGRSMLAHVLASVAAADVTDVAVVIGPGREDVRAEAQKLAPHSQVFVQADRLGTAHAVLAAGSAIGAGYDDLIVLFADTPLVTGETIRALRDALAAGAGVAALGFMAENPFGYGRLLQDDSSRLIAIREEKDASEAERAIRLCNAGLMAIDGHRALELLGRIEAQNAKGEYYLTDLVGIAAGAGLPVQARRLEDARQGVGVNTRVHLAEASAILRERINRQWMLAGVTLVDPATTYIEPGVTIGQDTVIWPNTLLRGDCVIGAGCELGPNTVLQDTRVGDGCVIIASFAEKASLEEDVHMGPYARLRPGARLDRGVHMGNFGEVKNSHLGAGVHMGHFSYIGDAEIGEKVNIGAGTITCNYDGVKKSRTEIGERAFIGSDTMLVAPVKIGAGSRTGAGAVVTRDVPDHTLAVGVPARAIRKLEKRD